VQRRGNAPIQVDTNDLLKALAQPLRRDTLHWLKDPKAYFADQTYAP
jgi:hypothetical protein